jgi:hypothetical protein
MNDVNWHYLYDDVGTIEESFDLLNKFGDSQILAETNITFRLSYAKYFDPCSEKLEDSNEKLIRFAFYE